jgi:hypothetical protein
MWWFFGAKAGDAHLIAYQKRSYKISKVPQRADSLQVVVRERSYSGSIA